MPQNVYRLNLECDYKHLQLAAKPRVRIEVHRWGVFFSAVHFPTHQVNANQEFTQIPSILTSLKLE